LPRPPGPRQTTYASGGEVAAVSTARVVSIPAGRKVKGGMHYQRGISLNHETCLWGNRIGLYAVLTVHRVEKCASYVG
jgi:hypothetical protein